MISEQTDRVWTRPRAHGDGVWHRVATVSNDAVVCACLRVFVAPVDFSAMDSGAIPCLACVSDKAALLRPQ